MSYCIGYSSDRCNILFVVWRKPAIYCIVIYLTLCNWPNSLSMTKIKNPTPVNFQFWNTVTTTKNLISIRKTGYKNLSQNPSVCKDTNEPPEINKEAAIKNFSQHKKKEELFFRNVGVETYWTTWFHWPLQCDVLILFHNEYNINYTFLYNQNTIIRLFLTISLKTTTTKNSTSWPLEMSCQLLDTDSSFKPIPNSIYVLHCILYGLGEKDRQACGTWINVAQQQGGNTLYWEWPTPDPALHQPC